MTLPEAEELEHRLALPIPKIYDTPLPLTGSPGQLLAHEPFTGYRFPANPDVSSKEMALTAERFVYRSRSVTGKDVPASGVVLIPYGKAPPGDGPSWCGRMAPVAWAGRALRH